MAASTPSSSATPSPSEASLLLDLSATQAAPSLRSGRRALGEYVGALLGRYEEVKFDALLLGFSPEALAGAFLEPANHQHFTIKAEQLGRIRRLRSG